MRILDINNNEISPENIDLEIGHLEKDQLFIQHHEAIEGQERQWHYWPKTYYFEDNSKYSITDEQDPHIQVIDLEKCKFGWNNLEGEELKKVSGIDVYQLETQPRIVGREEYDEYEEIQRYILYTEEELENIRIQREKEEKRNKFIEEGPDILTNTVELLDETTLTVDDLVLMMADMIGGEEEEVEE